MTRRRLAFAAIVVIAGAGAIVVFSDSESPAHGRPKAEPLLFVLTSRSGSLVPERAHPRRFTLTLRGISRQTVWFADRPARASGSLGTAPFMRVWPRLGFAQDPPNAALVFQHGETDGDRVIVELRAPRYDAARGTLAFAARWIEPSTVRSGNLAEHAKHVDPTPPERFADASLFIDDETQDLCVFTGQCMGIDLSGRDLSGLNFQEANFAGANLSNANLDQTDLVYSDFAGANLQGASLTGAVYDGATSCSTTLPDGSIQNPDCPDSAPDAPFSP